MDAVLKPTSPLVPATGTAGGSVVAGNAGPAGTTASTRANATRPADTDSRAATRTGATPASGLPRRGIALHHGLQGEVARAQQAIDYLERVAGQLEALKSDLSARLSGRGRDHGSLARGLEARARQLAGTLDARAAQAGGGVDAQLDYQPGGARQRFRIAGLDIAALQRPASQTLGFSVGSVGGPQLAATIEPGMSAEDIASRLDRALAPVQVRAGLDPDRQLVFSTPEASWSSVKDAIAVTGRGRVDTVALPGNLAPQDWELGNPDALRQSLREVVQSLARVRRSQDAASLALGAAMARTAQPPVPEAELASVAGNFAASAASHDYASLLAITSALSGVSRDRVQALLGLR